MKGDKPMLITFVNGGHAIYMRGGKGVSSTVSGYASPETVLKPYHWWSHPPEQMSYHVEPGTAEGCPVIDKREALKTETGIHMCLSGPMVDVNLKGGEIDRCPTPEPILESALMTPGNQFGGLLLMQKASRSLGRKYGPLDSVDTETFIELWREAGARIGRVQGNVIVWEDGGDHEGHSDSQTDAQEG